MGTGSPSWRARWLLRATSSQRSVGGDVRQQLAHARRGVVESVVGDEVDQAGEGDVRGEAERSRQVDRDLEHALAQPFRCGRQVAAQLEDARTDPPDGLVNIEST
jgi:hypothetical protein